MSEVDHNLVDGLDGTTFRVRELESTFFERIRRNAFKHWCALQATGSYQECTTARTRVIVHLEVLRNEHYQDSF